VNLVSASWIQTGAIRQGPWLFCTSWLCRVVATGVCIVALAAGCASPMRMPAQRYTFPLADEESPETPLPVQAFVVWEERIITENVQGPIASRLSEVTGHVIEDGVFKCTVPTNEICGLVSTSAPMLGIASGKDYRFTVFAPGYVAVTVHPYGVYGRPPDVSGPINRWDGPGMHNGSFASKHVTAASARVPMAWVRTQDGTVTCTIKLKPLPSRDDLEHLLNRTDFLKRGYPIHLFAYQVWLLANAIEKGYLDDIPHEARRTLLEALRAQHDCYGGHRMRRSSSRAEFSGKTHLRMFDECAENPKSPCHVIQNWACFGK
jgi:hypothetical protein